jgi:hypothetical protein
MAFLPGVRFRKTVSVLPGVKINMSKTGVSTSLGGNGATVNLGTRTRFLTLGIPGTGLSYRVPLTTGVFMILLAIAALVGIAYLIAPTTVKALLHMWQPKLF